MNATDPVNRGGTRICRPAYRSVACWLAWMLLHPLAVAAGPASDPAQALHTAIDEVMTVIYEPTADQRAIAVRAQPVMEKSFDFAALTRRAVGPGWRQFTPEQQQQATALLTTLIVRNYCTHFDSSFRARITYATPVPLAGDRCELPLTIAGSVNRYAVTYRAELTAGRWHFYDVVVEGVSLVANYRAQFAPLFQQGGASAIIRALEEKLASPAVPS